MYTLLVVHCLLNASPPALGKQQPPGWMLQGERAGGAEFSVLWNVKAGVLAEWQVCSLSLALPASLPFSIVNLERLQEMPGQFWGLSPPGRQRDGCQAWLSWQHVAAAPAAGEGHLSACGLLRSALPGPGAKTVAFVCSWLLACGACTRAVALSLGRLSPGNPRLSFLTPGWAGCLVATAQAPGEVIFC